MVARRPVWLRASLVCVVVASALSLAPPAGAAPLPLVAMECGSAVNFSFRLSNNITGCGADAILITAFEGPHLTIDLNGHRIEGLGTVDTRGINNPSHANVTIRNGTIANFDTGIVAGGVNNTVEDMVLAGNKTDGVRFSKNGAVARRNVVTRNLDDGIEVDTATGIVLEDNISAHNVWHGMSIGTNSSEATVRRNTLIGNRIGLLLDESTAVTAAGNRAILNSHFGILLDVTDRSTITGNKAIANDAAGIQLLTGSHRNLVSENRVTGNGSDGIQLSGSNLNTVKENVASANNDDGIEIIGGVSNDIKSNIANENGTNGILSPTGADVVSGNVANANGFLGTETGNNAGLGISATTILASNNSAAHNDADAQCNPVSLCDAGSTANPEGLVSCGKELFTSIRVRNSLANCSLGLDIRSNGITVDLGSHRIAGQGSERGIENYGGYRDVTIRNGVVKDFQENVFIDVAKRNVVSGIYSETNNWLGANITIKNTVDTVVANSFAADVDAPDIDAPGVYINQGARNVVRNNLFVGTTSGAFGHVTTGSIIENNRAIGTLEGFGFGFGSEGTAMRGNKVFGGRNGLVVNGGDRNVVAGNLIAGVTLRGIEVIQSAERTAVTNNVVRGNGTHGIYAEDVAPTPGVNIALRIAGNTVHGNALNGIYLFSGAGRVKVANNRANESGENGILSGVGGAAKIVDNIANRNGFLSDPNYLEDDLGAGIEAAGATGSGNIAKNNDKPACVPATLC